MTERIIPPSGPLNAKVLIIGEYPGPDELWKGVPFQGSAGMELARMLHDAGIILSECRTMYAYPWPAPGGPKTLVESTRAKGAKINATLMRAGRWHTEKVSEGLALLEAEIERLHPTVVITLGELALWAVTGESGITNWRGSLLKHSATGITVIPTYTAQMIQRAWEWRMFAVRDLKRAKDYLDFPNAYTPQYQFQVRPSYSAVMLVLETFMRQAEAGTRVELAADIETICRHISCLGLAWSTTEAVCIPFMDQGRHYWEEHEEIAIVQTLKLLLTHPNVKVIGQNFAGYDNQHFAKHWGFVPNLTFDTMLAQHTLYPGLDKALDVLSSLYCHYHRYWKDELKDYNKMPDDIHQYWTYNCLTGDTPVLDIYGRWRALQTIQVGDDILTFEEIPTSSRGARKLVHAEVTKTASSVKEILEIIFTDGTSLRGTPEHRVISKPGGPRKPGISIAPDWCELQHLKPGDSLPHVPQWAQVETFDTGWQQLPHKIIKDIRKAGTEVVYDITTTAGTFLTSSGVAHNCKDCVITFEVKQVLEPLLQKANLVEQFLFLMEMAKRKVFNAMLRGVRIDLKRRQAVASELMLAIAEREALIHTVVGFPLNVGSPKQMIEFFYNDLKLPTIKNRKTKQPTCNDEALTQLAAKFPLVKPLTDLISEKRSLGVFLSTFCLMPLDTDNRMRCSYNVAGTETFRLSSSENAFGTGGNLQNIPKGEEE